jgi:opacity protein-like surface antigen
MVGGLLMSAPAPAEERPKWWSSLFLGYSTSLEPGAPSGSVGGFVNGFAMVNAGIGIGVELGHQRLGKAQTTFLPEGATEPRPLEIGRASWQLTGNLLVRGSMESFRPYLNGGAGLYLLTTNASDPAYTTTDSKNQFGFNLGGGVVYNPDGKNWGFGIDARWHDIVKGKLGGGDLDILNVAAGFMFWGR